jgi:gluconate 2-dehydrogenase gamma chain
MIACMRLTRRQFCAQAGAGVVGVGAFVSLSACRSRQRTDAEPAPPPAVSAHSAALVTFSTATFATISAVAERLLPRDGTPGAIDLGVPRYIDRMVASPDMINIREMLSHLLPLLDQQSRKRYKGKAFHEAAAEEQDSLLESWQHSHGASQQFFDVMLALTLEGAFGDPKYGGNTDGQGFAMIGFTPGPPLMKMAPMLHDH